MTPVELIERARSQAEVSVDREIGVPGPRLRRLLHSGRPLLVSELLEHPDKQRETRRYRYGHVLGPGLSSAAIAQWQEQHPDALLSSDVVGLLQQIDGVHLWADLDAGRSYFGILPL